MVPLSNLYLRNGYLVEASKVPTVSPPSGRMQSILGSTVKPATRDNATRAMNCVCACMCVYGMKEKKRACQVSNLATNPN